LIKSVHHTNTKKYWKFFMKTFNYINCFNHLPKQGLLHAALSTSCAAAVLTCSVFFVQSAHAQINNASPTVATLNVSTGGTVTTTVTALDTTGNRNATAALCSSITGALGVSSTLPCTGTAQIGTVNVGAQTSTPSSQTYSANFTPSQLSGIATALGASGQPFGSRKFYIVTTYVYTGLSVPITRYATTQVSLIEPGLTAASSNFFDVAMNNPSRVPVRYTLSGPDTPLAGQFCSSLASGYPAAGVSNGNPCAAGSNLGLSGAAIGFSNGALQTGENLPVPTAVAAQAAQRAQASGNSLFYFVRQFSSGRFAVVQLRLSNTAVNASVSFNEIRLGFKDGNAIQNIGFFKRGQILPPVIANIRYQGAGMLRARWEVVQPGDMPLNNLDLTSEASLTPLERAQQHRYRVLDRVNVYLPAFGQAVIPGPAPRLLPNEQYGMYQVLLRIEAADAMNGTQSGGTSFTLPVLRYYIGESSGPNFASAHKASTEPISLVSPQSNDVLSKDAPAVFQWLENKDVSLYRLELEANGKPVFSARVRANTQDGINRYTAPPFVTAKLLNTAARWRIVALASDGQFVGESEWREIANGQ
jgi:hypothetical protein